MRFHVLVAAALLSACAAAHADTVSSFDLSGAIDPASNNVSGTVWIDTTNGSVSAAQISAALPSSGPSGDLNFNMILEQFDDGSTYIAVLYNDTGQDLDLLIQDGGSLDGYGGGSTGLTLIEDGPDFSISEGLGQLTPAPAPEPASMALLGSGLLGIAAVARRRMRS